MLRDAPLDFRGGVGSLGKGGIFFAPNGGGFFSSPSRGGGRNFFSVTLKKVCSKHKDDFFRPLTGAIFFHLHGEGNFFSENFLPRGNLMVRP